MGSLFTITSSRSVPYLLSDLSKLLHLNFLICKMGTKDQSGLRYWEEILQGHFLQCQGHGKCLVIKPYFIIILVILF